MIRQIRCSWQQWLKCAVIRGERPPNGTLWRLLTFFIRVLVFQTVTVTFSRLFYCHLFLISFSLMLRSFNVAYQKEVGPHQHFNHSYSRVHPPSLVNPENLPELCPRISSPIQQQWLHTIFQTGDIKGKLIEP